MLSKVLLIAAAVTGFGSRYDNDWPPARFQQLGTAWVTFGTQRNIDRLCGKAPRGMITDACSNDERIVLPNPCAFASTEVFARFACHELAHHFGNWPGDHPK